jgi:hypothetical protein
MVFNTTFTHISVISWQSVLLVEETGENFCLKIDFVRKNQLNIRGLGGQLVKIVDF